MTPLHEAALGYAERGVPVFPIAPGRKEPATEHGFKDATTDPARINAWWGMGDWNIGTSPGATGHAVIDIDDKNGKEGSKVWAKLCADLGEPASGLTVRTPSGGRHLWFQGALPSSAGKLGGGIDVRSEGGYVLLPPSVVDGKPYEWVNTGAPVPPPGWLVLAAALSRTPNPAPAPTGEAISEDTVRRMLAVLDSGCGRDEWRNTIAAIRAAPIPDDEDESIRRALAHEWSEGAHNYTGPEAVDLVFNSMPPKEGGISVASLIHAARAAGCQDLPAAEKYGPAAHLTMPKGTLRRGDTYMMRDIEWIWPGWLARGKMHILGGQKGAGKSTISFSILAAITTGGLLPDGVQAPLGDVLIWSGEDDIEDTILPRLVAAGGDRRRVFFPDKIAGRPFDPATDFPTLHDACRGLPDLMVVMVDPIVSASTADSHKNAETRRGLQPLVDFAAERNVALLGITHFTKNTQGRDPIERITGTLAYGAMARIVWGAAKGEDEDATRKLVRISSNVGEGSGGFEYGLERVPVAGKQQPAQRVKWGDVLHGSALELLGDSGPRTSAEAFITQRLTDAGNAGVFSRELFAEAREMHGISEQTMRKAKAKMPRVQAKKNLGSNTAPWSWILLPVNPC